MAMNEASPLPGPIKKKIKKFNIPRSPPKGYSGEKIIINCPYFLKAKPGHPPSREYKQSMAMQASPLPNPLKRKLMHKNLCI